MHLKLKEAAAKIKYQSFVAKLGKNHNANNIEG